MEEQIYRVSFQNGEEFLGGSIQFPKWTKCPDLGIKSFELILPYDDRIVLSNYEKYNFFIGAIKPLVGEKKLTIIHLFTMGCKKNLVTSYRVTLLSRDKGKHRIGDMTVRQFPFGKEGMGRNPTSGWKKGIS